MYEKNFPIERFANVLKNNLNFAGRVGQIQDAQLIYYFLVNKYDAANAPDVIRLTLELFRKPAHELNEIITQIENKMNKV